MLLVSFLLFTADFIILPKAILALLWIIVCCGIIADASLDNGHSLSLSVLLPHSSSSVGGGGQQRERRREINGIQRRAVGGDEDSLRCSVKRVSECPRRKEAALV